MKIIDREDFMNVPVSTRCLQYFEFLHKANENGVCTNPGRVLKRGNYTQDDIILLIEKGVGKLIQEGIKLAIYQHLAWEKSQAIFNQVRILCKIQIRNYNT